MRKLALFMLAFVPAISLCAEDLGVPSDVTLSNGFVMKGCSVIAWRKDGVSIKYVGGIAPVTYAHMAPQSRAVFENLVSAVHECKGVIYVVTKGQDVKKLADVTVYVIPESDYSSVQPQLELKTDVDGRFSFRWKGPGTFMLRAFATRATLGGGEAYLWEMRRENIDDLSNIVLNNDNLSRIR